MREQGGAKTQCRQRQKKGSTGCHCSNSRYRKLPRSFLPIFPIRPPPLTFLSDTPSHSLYLPLSHSLYLPLSHSLYLPLSLSPFISSPLPLSISNPLPFLYLPHPTLCLFYVDHPTPTRILYIYSILRFISVSLFSLNIFSPSTLFLYTSSTFFLCVPLPLSFYIPLPLSFHMFHSLSICSTSTLFLYICSTPTLFLFSPLLHSFFCTYRIILKHSQQFPPLFHHFILSIPLPFYFYISFPSFYFFFF